MKEEERSFYYELFPILGQADWQATGASAFGDVAWWVEFGGCAYEEIVGRVKVGLRLLPNDSSLFVRVEQVQYPKRCFTKTLKASPKTVTLPDLVQEAFEMAIALLEEHAQETRTQIQEFEAEIDSYRGK
jgi:hypothetical protein